jgi:putative oxidoreductase
MVSTRSGLGVTLLRLVIGGIFFKAGAGKLFGWFGGIGILGVTDFFQGIGIPFPEFNAYLVGLTEFLGGIALLLGLFTRLAAFPFIITMIVAIFTAHRDGDFYYPLVLITGCLALLETGGGVFSLDRWLESNPFTHPFRMRNWNIFSLNSGSSEGAFRKEPAAFMRR